MTDVYEKAAAALSEMHSHEIVLEEAIVVLADEVGLEHSATADGRTWVIWCPEASGRRAHVRTRSYRQMSREIAFSKPGGHLENAGDGARYVPADEIAMAVRLVLVGGEDPGSRLHGRGSAHRARIEQIAQRGQEVRAQAGS